MTRQLRSELLKQRSTRTNVALLASMLALVLLVVLLHGLALPSRDVAQRSFQLKELFGRGETLGALFAALLGAMSITSEFRHGTIRPTLLATPRRGRVLAAKLGAGVLVGAVFGLIAAAVAEGAGAAILGARGVDVRLDAGDLAVLLAGSAAAGALWAAIGVAIGAVVRNQVPMMVGLCAWLLFVEALLLGDASSLADVGRFLPGALGSAASGQDASLAPAVAVVLLALYAAVASVAGYLSIDRRDVA